MLVLRILLFPFAILYDGATRFRNHLYNIGHWRSFRFEIPVIGVGNLNAGGSGKTPMIEYLIRLLMDTNNISVLSRGYGRLTRGLRFANDNETARTIGDEPLQFFRSFKSKVNVVVCEDRAFAIPNILQEYPQTNLILMDDSFQHRSVNPKFNILLTEYASPFYSDYVLPAGKLREARACSRRADVIVVTKCPAQISEKDRREKTDLIKKIAGEKPVYFTSIQYGKAVSFGNANPPMMPEVILVSGIANHKIFEDYARRVFHVVKHFCFKDHHRFNREELLGIREFVRVNANPVSILTTEKDMARLIDPEFLEILGGMPWFYLPIETVFLKDGSEFDEKVRNSIVLPE